VFIEDKVTIGIKAETTAGTVAAPIAADYNIRVGGLTYDHVIAEYARKYASGNHSNDKSIMGKQTGTFSFHVDLAEGTAINARNPVYVLLQACGALDTIMTTTGVKYTPYSPYDVKTVTVDIVEKDEGLSPVQTVMRFAGCMGNCRMNMQEVGQPIRLEFEMQGKLADIFDRAFGSIIAPAFVAVEPTRVLAATITRGAVVQSVETFVLDFGNDLQFKTDAADGTGVGHFYIAKRKPMLNIDPYLKTLAGDPAYTEWKAGTTALFTFTIGNFSITVPKAQYIGLKPAVRNGARTLQKSMLCVKNSDAGDDEWQLLQGTAS
jgi:hypothetical protein